MEGFIPANTLENLKVILWTEKPLMFGTAVIFITIGLLGEMFLFGC